VNAGISARREAFRVYFSARVGGFIIAGGIALGPEVAPVGRRVYGRPAPFIELGTRHKGRFRHARIVIRRAFGDTFARRNQWRHKQRTKQEEYQFHGIHRLNIMIMKTDSRSKPMPSETISLWPAAKSNGDAESSTSRGTYLLIGIACKTLSGKYY
jgi:hypothetical protein